MKNMACCECEHTALKQRIGNPLLLDRICIVLSDLLLGNPFTARTVHLVCGTFKLHFAYSLKSNPPEPECTFQMRQNRAQSLVLRSNLQELSFSFYHSMTYRTNSLAYQEE